MWPHRNIAEVLGILDLKTVASADERSAQLILEQAHIRNDLFSDFNLATRVLCAEVIRLAEQLNIELAETQADLLRPLAIYSVYQVAQIYDRQYRRDPNPDYENGIHTLLKTLGFFEQRWRVAGELFRYFQA